MLYQKNAKSANIGFGLNRVATGAPAIWAHGFAPHRTALCRGASRQRYAGGRADSVMPSQRYAFPALCLIIPIVPIIPNKHRICLNMLYLGRLFLKNVVFAQTVTFLRKKTAGGHTPGLNQRLYLPKCRLWCILYLNISLLLYLFDYICGCWVYGIETHTGSHVSWYHQSLLLLDCCLIDYLHVEDYEEQN